ncbi:hypothetical protein TRIATDRAFT_312361 [Trichoderma atroviride IMI 206040]|uniref:RING-type domain-containing protein n=2 Tax=Hypocrea atroviridis TaxID=63577 RepID=G9P8V0_HYPAI|nr:uncharacterized protein TRIATDRAFT_312361 [Trichoderma atroviride IMI 206040]EHK41822.1 hypothetical protein TRIATDRAFT_312361 [Trichoderma atroviride IMI 206040]
MGAGHSKQSIKDRLQRALRPPWARAKKGSDSELQSEKLEVSVTRTISRGTAPTIRAPSPLAPAETQLAVASGILGKPMPKQPFLSAIKISREPFTMSSTTSRSDISESLRSHNMQSPLEVSPVSDQSTIRPLARQLGNITSSEPTSEHVDNVSPMSQSTVQPLASPLRDIPPLDFTSRYESDAVLCHFCEQPYSDEGEPKVYLPCGHSFGLDCLYRWISNVLSLVIFDELPFAHFRCPYDCISLRHLCGHLVTPYDSPPHPLHTDVSAFAIPSAYEFCRKGRGRKLSRDIKRLRSMEKALVGDPDHLLQRGKRHKILDVLSFHRPPFSTKLLSMVKDSRLKAETDLWHEQRTWWLDEWAKRWWVNIRESWFYTHHPWETEMQIKFLQDLELLGS